VNTEAYCASLAAVALAVVVNGGAGSWLHFAIQMYLVALLCWAAVAVL
jgi:hypothetical protein